MEILAIIFGLFISIVVIVHFKKTRLESSRFAYSLLLISFPFYYMSFAIYAHDYVSFALELGAGIVFFVLGALALKLDNFYKFLLLATGYIFHAIYDVSHDVFFINAGTPGWWPEFCFTVDLLIGLYLVGLAFTYKIKLA